MHREAEVRRSVQKKRWGICVMLDSHSCGNNARAGISVRLSRLRSLRFADSFRCADVVVNGGALL